jgi:hypothetical protein
MSGNDLVKCRECGLNIAQIGVPMRCEPEVTIWRGCTYAALSETHNDIASMFVFGVHNHRTRAETTVLRPQHLPATGAQAVGENLIETVDVLTNRLDSKRIE